MALPVAIAPAHNKIRQQNPVGLGALPVAQWIDCIQVAAASVTYTVPAGMSFIRLTPLGGASDLFFGCWTGAAVIPSGNVTNGTGSFLIGQGELFAVNPGTVLAVISQSATAQPMTIEGWA